MVANEGYDVELGARPLKRAIERRVTVVMARALMASSSRRSQQELWLTMEGGAVIGQVRPRVSGVDGARM